MGSKQTKNKEEINLNNDPITKEYFNDLQLIFIHNYLENDNLVANMKVCLDEKNFDQILETNDLPKEDDQIIYDGLEFINWLDFLYQYLEEERGKIETGLSKC